MASPLTLALGKDIGGNSVVADLARMPHLLIAGTTGSGKSVGINAMVLSILYKAQPEQVRMIMIDPKMLELSVYEGIPHLLAPVVTDMKEAVQLAALVRRRDGSALSPHVGARRAQYRRLQPQGQGGDRCRRAAQGSDVPPAGHFRRRQAHRSPDADAAAVHRRHHRRAGRHDDDRRQEGRRADCATGAEGAGVRHPHDSRDAASVGRRDYRPDQGQCADAHRVPGFGQGRFADDSRSAGRREPARPWRHAVSAARHLAAGARARRVCRRPRGPRGGSPSEEKWHDRAISMKFSTVLRVQHQD